MLVKNVEVTLKNGLHAKNAAEFVQEASKYSSDIYLEKGGKKINGKSIMGIMSFAVGPGTRITIMADGPDEEEALESLINLIGK